MTKPGGRIGRSAEIANHTHGRIELAMQAHMSMHEDDWQPYRVGEGAQETLWYGATFYRGLGSALRMGVFAMTPPDAIAPPDEPTTFYFNAGLRPLVPSGRTFWQWHGAMDPDEKEVVAALSEEEMDRVLSLVLHGKCVRDKGVFDIQDGQRSFFPRLPVVRGTEPKLSTARLKDGQRRGGKVLSYLRGFVTHESS